MTTQFSAESGEKVQAGVEGSEGAPVHRVQELRHLNECAYVIRIDRHGLPARAGQCVTLGAAGSGLNREYSLYADERAPYFEFLIREIVEGQVSRELKKSLPGDPVEMAGPYGNFVIEKPEDPERKYLFIGTGTGIGPFHSFVRSYPELDYKIIHGVRCLKDRYDMEDYDPGRYIACASREKGGNFWGRVTDYLRKHPAEPEAFCYLCGNSVMVEEAFEILRWQGVSTDQIFTEVFF